MNHFIHRSSDFDNLDKNEEGKISTDLLLMDCAKQEKKYSGIFYK